MAIEEEVTLDIAQALTSVDTLEAALATAVDTFSTQLADAFSSNTAPETTGQMSLFDPSQIEAAGAATKGLAGDLSAVAAGAVAADSASGGLFGTLGQLADIPGVQAVAAFFGGREVIRQIQDMTSAADDLNLQIKQAPLIFGAAASSILGFSQDSVSSLALSQQATVTQSNAIGRVLTAQGVSQQTAAALTESVMKRAADLATVTGKTTDQAAAQIQAGMLGMSRAVRDLGASYTAAEVNAKAASMGAVAVNGAYDQGALIQARAAIILEKTATAQGALAANSDSLAVRQRKLTAEWQDAQAKLGQGLIPAMTQLVKAVEDNLPGLERLIASIIPLLISGIQTAIPILSGFANIFELLAPVLKLVGTIFSALPGPVREAALAFVLLGTGIGPLPNLLHLFSSSAVVASGTEGLGALAAGFTDLNPYVLAAIVAIPILTTLTNRHAAEARADAAAVRDAATAYGDLTKSVDAVSTGIAGSNIGASQKAILDQIGLGVDGLAKGIQGGTLSLQDFLTQLNAAGFVQFHNGVTSIAQAVTEYGSVQKAVMAGAITDNNGLIVSYNKTFTDIQKGSQVAANGLVHDQKITKAAFDDAVTANTVGGVTNWVAVLLKVRPAAADAAAGAGNLGAQTDTLTSSLDAATTALKDVQTGLDNSFGKYLSAADAVGTLQGAVLKLGDELGKGPAKGQSMLAYQQQLSTDLRGVVKDVEANAFAMAKAGQIGADSASVSAEMVKELEALAVAFPELNGPIAQYIGLLDAIPLHIETQLTVYASSIANTDPNLAGVISAVGYLNAQDTATQAGKKLAGDLASGILSNIGATAAAGRAAGTAAGAAAGSSAVAAAISVLTSASSGLDIGGFLVQGIILDPNQKHAQELQNFFRLQVQGIGDAVSQAMQVDPAEQAAITQAIEKVAQDTRNLGDARDKLGANSIEAAIAEQQLAADEANVNTVMLASTDTTKAYTDALAKVQSGIDSVTSSLKALNSVVSEQNAVRDATTAVQKEQDALRRLDAMIADRTALLANTADATTRTRLTAQIADLERQKAAHTTTLAADQSKLQDAELTLIGTQQQLVDLGPKVSATDGAWQTYFRNLATQAGLTTTEVDGLVASLTTAGGLAQQTSNNVLNGSPNPLSSAPMNAAGMMQGVLLGVPAAPAPTAPVPPAQNTFNIYEATSARSTALQIVNEQRAVALLGG